MSEPITPRGFEPRSLKNTLGRRLTPVEPSGEQLPPGAVLLASTDTCPVHAFRIGRHVYATQFHPELDAVAICDRIDAYSAHGYYEPHEQGHLKAAAREAMVTEPVRLLARFVEL